MYNVSGRWRALGPTGTSVARAVEAVLFFEVESEVLASASSDATIALWDGASVWDACADAAALDDVRARGALPGWMRALVATRSEHLASSETIPPKSKPATKIC